MIKNILRITWRNLKKYKLYSFVNILGLALGLLAVFCISLFVEHELGYDKQHPFAEQTYRVDVEGLLGDQELNSAQVAALVGPTAMEELPQVSNFCRLRSYGSYLVKFEEEHYREDRVIFADSSLFEVFALDLSTGDPATALKEPNTAVISPATAEKYFAGQDPIGQTLILDNEYQYTVAGVLAEMPDDMHFQFDLYLSMSTLENSMAPEWGSMNYNTYLVLEPGTDVATFEPIFSEHIVRNYFAPYVEPYIGSTWDEFLEAGNKFRYDLFPLADIHLHSARQDELGANSDAQYIWGFGLIGFFILLLACINYTNLSTARASVRAREIGVRKVVGADRQHLIRQFLGESVMVSFLSLVLAMGALYALLPSFNMISGKSFVFADLLSPGFLAFSCGLTLLTGLLAGAYPSLILSKARPLSIMRGKLQLQGSKSYFRNGLVVFQFFTAIVIAISTLVVYQQIQYIQQKKLGYDREQVLLLNDAYALNDQVNAFKEQALAFPDVQSATVTGFLPTPSYGNSNSFFVGRNPDASDVVIINNWRVDHDYIQTMGMNIAAGRDFSRDFPTDSAGVIINQRTARFFEGDPLGQYLSTYDANDELEFFKVIGVVEDFHYESLRNNIEALGLFLAPSTGYVALRMNTDNYTEAIQKLEILWNRLAPGSPFSYAFMDERFNSMYNNEMQLGRIMLIFSGLAVIVACIGLIGLTTFLTQQRTKEIGIRKVLGASIQSIIGLLSRQFVGLIVLALILSVPAAWYVVRQWLQNFAYQVEVNSKLFLVAGLSTIGLAFLLIATLTIRASLANPADSLKSE